MKREYIKKVLSQKGYSGDSIKSILCGRMRPSYNKIIEMHEKDGIPFSAWRDIRAYLQANDAEKEHRKVG